MRSFTKVGSNPTTKTHNHSFCSVISDETSIGNVRAAFPEGCFSKILNTSNPTVTHLSDGIKTKAKSTFNTVLNFEPVKTYRLNREFLEKINREFLQEIDDAINIESVDIDKCLFLVVQGANANIKNSKGNTLLHLIAVSDYNEQVQTFFDSEISKLFDFNVINFRENTPAHEAILKGNSEILAQFIDRKTDINAPGQQSFRLLHLAVLYGELEIVRLLLSKGAALQSTTQKGKTPLHIVAQDRNDPLLRYDGQRYTDIDEETINRVNEAKKLVLAKVAKVNCKDNDGNTPLHQVCKNGDKELVRMLIENGADINIKNNDGETPLYQAYFHKYIGMQTCTYWNSHFGTNRPFESGHTEIIKILSEHGANMYETTSYGNTIFHLACEYGDKELIEELVRNGVDINRANKEGLTPLHYLTSRPFSPSLLGRKKFVLPAELLIEKGANFNAINQDGHKPTINLDHFLIIGESIRAFEEVLNVKFNQLSGDKKAKHSDLIDFGRIADMVDKPECKILDKKLLLKKLILLLQKFNSSLSFGEKNKKYAFKVVCQFANHMDDYVSIDDDNKFFVQYCILLLLEMEMIPSDLQNYRAKLRAFKDYPVLAEFLLQRIKEEETTTGNANNDLIKDMLNQFNLKTTMFTNLFKILRKHNLQLHPDMSLEKVQEKMNQVLQSLPEYPHSYPVVGITDILILLMNRKNN